MEITSITILCQVLDNYGDIGVAHRLAKEIDEITGGKCTINLVVNNLASYRAICPSIKAKSVQKMGNITVLDCNDDASCIAHYAGRPPAIILQCFQCAYPAWLEDMLFASKLYYDVHIIDIDYLTAETWADDFHLMKSLTRRGVVHKAIFMPGFTNKTGGLLMQGRIGVRLSDGFSSPSAAPILPRTVFVFGYDRDYTPLTKALSNLSRISTANGQHLKVYAAGGVGQKAFLKAWENAHKMFPVETLPFMRQEEWDKMLMGADSAFVRGEDSLAGAALSGIPYVWEAYKQEGGAQMDKVNALLCLMQPYFDNAHYTSLAALWRLWNSGTGGADSAKDKEKEEQMTSCIYNFFVQYASYKEGFARFAAHLERNGDMAAHLIDYIRLL